MFAKAVRAISGKPIRLTEERWQHIIERHPEVEGHLNEVLKVIENPEIITAGWQEEVIALRRFKNHDLAVVYKERDREGFVITAFLTRSREYFIKRGVLWIKT